MMTKMKVVIVAQLLLVVLFRITERSACRCLIILLPFSALWFVKMKFTEDDNVRFIKT